MFAISRRPISRAAPRYPGGQLPFASSLNSVSGRRAAGCGVLRAGGVEQAAAAESEAGAGEQTAS
jgi:hypothetical protein